MTKVVSKWWLCLLLALLPLMQAKADNPLTSTDFYRAYINRTDFPKFDDANLLQFMEYITNPDNRLDYRLALINKAGWDPDGKHRSFMFIDYLIEMGKFKSVEDFYLQADGGLMICYAYLKALDNYFDVTDAALIANMAALRMPESYAVQIVNALILAQHQLLGDFNEPVGKYTKFVQDNEEVLEDDFLPDAKAIIFEYMDMYNE